MYETNLVRHFGLALIRNTSMSCTRLTASFLSLFLSEGQRNFPAGSKQHLSELGGASAGVVLCLSVMAVTPPEL